MPQAGKDVVPTSKSVVANKSEPPTSVVKPAIQDGPSLEAKEPEWTPASGSARPANVSDAMILDSNSVRGRYTGIEHLKAKVKRPAPQEETPSTPDSPPVPSPKEPVTPPAQSAPAPVAAPAPAPQTEGAPNLDADGPFGSASPNLPAAGQTSHEPTQKPLSGVVNAVAQQVSPAPVADPFALEQAAEANVADPSQSPKPHALASANLSQELDPFGEPSLLGSNQAPTAESTAVAPIQAHAWPALRSELAFIIGLAVGLSAGLVVWLRSRLRKAHVHNA